MRNASDVESGRYRQIMQGVAADLDATRRWWTNFLFHFTTVGNAVNIIKSGTLFSRNRAKHLILDFEDAASPEILNQTNERWMDFVRLYFRPRTPTLFHNEGYRPAQSQQLHAHCPMPIYFLFDLVPILSDPTSEFSSQTLASRTATYQSVEEFRSLPFQLIYHDERFGQEDKDKVIKARHAEVIVPNSLDLVNVRYICCRSQAEKETLRNLLRRRLWQKWQGKVKVARHQAVFFNRWLFVDHVTLRNDDISVKFNLPQDVHDLQHLVVVATITDELTGRRFASRIDAAQLQSGQHVLWGLTAAGIRSYEYRIEIDGHLAYLGRRQESDIPY